MLQIRRRPLFRSNNKRGRPNVETPRVLSSAHHPRGAFSESDCLFCRGAKRGTHEGNGSASPLRGQQQCRGAALCACSFGELALCVARRKLRPIRYARPLPRASAAREVSRRRAQDFPLSLLWSSVRVHCSVPVVVARCCSVHCAPQLAPCGWCVSRRATEREKTRARLDCGSAQRRRRGRGWPNR